MKKFRVRQVISAVSTLILLTALAQGQNLFVTDYGSNNIYKFTPDGTQSTFASGLAGIFSLACDNEGNLFVDSGSLSNSNIYKFTHDGTRSTFASLPSSHGLACDSADNLFVADYLTGRIYKYTPDGTRSIFASGLNNPKFLAFQPIPEPASVILMGAGFLFARLRLRQR